MTDDETIVRDQILGARMARAVPRVNGQTVNVIRLAPVGGASMSA